MKRVILCCDTDSYSTLSSIAAISNFIIMGIVFSRRANDLEVAKLLNHVEEASKPRVLNIKRPDEMAEFIELNHVDLILVMSFDTIIPKKILDIPSCRFLNIHCGKVPSYRGANVLNWAIINGQQEIGISLLEIDSGIDAGPIVFETLIPINDSDTAYTVREQLLNKIVSDIPQVLSQYLDGDIVPYEQEQANVLVYKRRSPEDGIFDWSWCDRDIYNLIRALVSPWPGARYHSYRDGQIKIIDEFMSIEQIQRLRKLEMKYLA